MLLQRSPYVMKRLSIAKPCCRRLDGNPSSLQRSLRDKLLRPFSHRVTLMLRIAAIYFERLKRLTHVMLPSRRCLKQTSLEALSHCDGPVNCYKASVSAINKHSRSAAAGRGTSEGQGSPSSQRRALADGRNSPPHQRTAVNVLLAFQG